MYVRSGDDDPVSVSVSVPSPSPFPRTPFPGAPLPVASPALPVCPVPASETRGSGLSGGRDRAQGQRAERRVQLGFPAAAHQHTVHAGLVHDGRPKPEVDPPRAHRVINQTDPTHPEAPSAVQPVGRTGPARMTRSATFQAPEANPDPLVSLFATSGTSGGTSHPQMTHFATSGTSGGTSASKMARSATLRAPEGTSASRMTHFATRRTLGGAAHLQMTPSATRRTLVGAAHPQMTESATFTRSQAFFRRANSGDPSPPSARRPTPRPGPVQLATFAKARDPRSRECC